MISVLLRKMIGFNHVKNDYLDISGKGFSPVHSNLAPLGHEDSGQPLFGILF